MLTLILFTFIQPPQAPPVRLEWEWRRSGDEARLLHYGEHVGTWVYSTGQYWGDWDGRRFRPARVPDAAPAVPSVSPGAEARMPLFFLRECLT